jgi:hypothetical protein
VKAGKYKFEEEVKKKIKNRKKIFYILAGKNKKNYFFIIFNIIINKIKLFFKFKNILNFEFSIKIYLKLGINLIKKFSLFFSIRTGEI